jgi:hypothetical protein
VKSYLTVREIEYDSIDVTADPAGYPQLRALGALTTPVVAIGDQWISGAAYDRLDAFFRANGLGSGGGTDSADGTKSEVVGTAVGNVFAEAGTPTVILDEAQLAERLDGFLVKASRYLRALPADMLPVPLPERGKEGRTVRGLGWHISQVAQDPLRAADGVAIVKAMHEYDPPDTMSSGQALAARCDDVAAALAELWSSGVSLPSGPVEYFHGPYTFHGLLERTTWHVATHLRQLAWVLVEAGIDSNAGLTADDTANLPMPMAVWK